MRDDATRLARRRCVGVSYPKDIAFERERGSRGRDRKKERERTNLEGGERVKRCASFRGMYSIIDRVYGSTDDVAKVVRKNEPRW